MSFPTQRLFSGRWTKEEERYAQALMKEFREGCLPIAEGTSLRGHLAEELQCGPKRISKKYEGTGYNGKQSYVRRVAITQQHQDLTERRHDLEMLRQSFIESRKRVAAGLTGIQAAPSRQTYATGERRDTITESLGTGSATTQMLSTLDTGQQGMMLTQFDRNNFAAAALSRSNIPDGPPPSNAAMLANSRLGLMANYLQERDAHLDSIFENRSTRATGNFPLSGSNSLAAAALMPTGSGQGFSDPLAMHTPSMAQSLLDRMVEQSLLQQQRIRNASFLGRIQPGVLPPARYPSQPTQDAFLMAQLQSDRQQRHFFQTMTEGTPYRTLSSSMNLASSIAHQGRQEESKGQEESKRPTSGLDDDAPAPKRQRNF